MKSILLYIDPGSGSYLIQMLIAGVLGSLFFFKNAWRKVKSFFTGNKAVPEEEDDENETEQK